MEKVFQDELMSPHIADNGRGRAEVLVRLSATLQVRGLIPQVRSEQAILRDNQSAFRAGKFQLAGVAWICRCSRLQNSERSVGELEESNQRVLGLNRMETGLACGLHPDHVTAQTQH